MSSVNTCLMTRLSGKSPETDSNWVSHWERWGAKDGRVNGGGINERRGADGLDEEMGPRVKRWMKLN